LLTHEFLHVINLIDINPPMKINYFRKNNQKKVRGKEITSLDEQISTLEMYVNSFAAILHNYLLSKEMKLDLKILMRNELIYSFINCIRACKIQDTNLEKIYNTIYNKKFFAKIITNFVIVFYN
jgi:hypothetical protein